MARYRKLTIGITWRNNMSLLEQQTRAIIEAEMLKPEVWRNEHGYVLLHKTLPINLVRYDTHTEQLDTSITFDNRQFDSVVESLKEYKKFDRMNSIVEMYKKESL
jgi:hypothetical protein